ncbi:hypothetical protein Kpol_507p1 [Vanderwaltozyma polyspora DSM 70294]|uniref:Uncharacterized protein n=1 Tax=Vanderwaltozyma polyspora (strain ATCC 22028 / DSM 70294 / BCRC 21397 / CBS 2163 / NBRC 10782 / NRRL Y-8283 / UCD 57-17) TaxID=436907 RepID=A7TPF3_VANPO|nr:uncharacterized protein Kpol_507p1 [Vanderwaltozyma polyspora DSM 70294]EDO15839.1 hypothetical protein Kpol_507p1 [Vanderwaltozyma polyspora DSM 70294]
MHPSSETATHIITTDSAGHTTVITSPVPTSSVASETAKPTDNTVTHITTTDSAGHTTVITSPVPTSSVASETAKPTDNTVTHITTTDSAGHTTVITSSVPNSNTQSVTTLVPSGSYMSTVSSDLNTSVTDDITSSGSNPSANVGISSSYEGAGVSNKISNSLSGLIGMIVLAILV